MPARILAPAAKYAAAAVLLLAALAAIVPAHAQSLPPTWFSTYAWRLMTPHAEWPGRAGLQAVNLDGNLYVMGGRGAFSPFATTIYGDVWKSTDLGVTWTEVAASPWPARAYFQAVAHQGQMFIFGGQNFDTLPNPNYPTCPGNPPGVPCLPFVPNSTFFGDVWKSADGAAWTQVTPAAAWSGRAGLSAVVFKNEIYVLAGSRGDDASTGGQGRVFYNDVWKSSDGATWTQVTGAAPWAPRAGAAVVAKDGFIYLLGGERGFTCGGAPGCNAERDLYFHDVWRSANGADWEEVTPAAGWSARPGHQCLLLSNEFVCFGGYGEPNNPDDVWVSPDGKDWSELTAPASPAWNVGVANDAKYDFDALVVQSPLLGNGPSIMTFGGDRERFELPPNENATRVDNDVWALRLAPSYLPIVARQMRPD